MNFLISSMRCALRAALWARALAPIDYSNHAVRVSACGCGDERMHISDRRILLPFAVPAMLVAATRLIYSCAPHTRAMPSSFPSRRKGCEEKTGQFAGWQIRLVGS